MVKAGRIMISIFLLLKFPHVSASATEDTSLRIIFHYVWIGPFLSGLSFIGFGNGQSLI